MICCVIFSIEYAFSLATKARRRGGLKPADFNKSAASYFQKFSVHGGCAPTPPVSISEVYIVLNELIKSLALRNYKDFSMSGYAYTRLALNKWQHMALATTVALMVAAPYFRRSTQFRSELIPELELELELQIFPGTGTGTELIN